MIKFELNEKTVAYFNRRIKDYEENKLHGVDEQQLFQDLYDSGYIKHLPQYEEFVNRLAEAGLISTITGQVIH